MTETLANKACTPCRGGIPPLTREQAELFRAQAPDWQLSDEARRIERSFRFHNFREALTFVQEIGELAEAEGHHPNINFGWGNATVSLRLRRSRDCMRMTSSWQPRSTAYSLARPQSDFTGIEVECQALPMRHNCSRALCPCAVRSDPEDVPDLDWIGSQIIGATQSH